MILGTMMRQSGVESGIAVCLCYIKMNLCFATIVALSVVAYVEGCCVPKKWQGVVIGQGAIENETPIRHYRRTFDLYYDATDLKVAAVQPTGAGAVKYIGDFKAKKAYVINDDVCNSFPWVVEFYELCSDHGTFVTKAVAGGSVVQSLYTETLGDLTGTYTFADKDCIPMEEYVYGDYQGETITTAVLTVNVTALEDPKIFDPPASCQPGVGQFSDLLENLGASSVLQYHILNKFTNITLSAKTFARKSGKAFKSNYGFRKNSVL